MGDIPRTLTYTEDDILQVKNKHLKMRAKRAAGTSRDDTKKLQKAVRRGSKQEIQQDFTFVGLERVGQLWRTYSDFISC